MHLEAEQALRHADELLLVTRGRRSGREHAVTLRFAYADGSVWLRTEPRDAPRTPAATVVVRRGAARPPDWYRNLAAEPRCRVHVGGFDLPGNARPLGDPQAALHRAVELWRAKYGAEWVADWYLDAGRIPVRVELG